MLAAVLVTAPAQAAGQAGKVSGTLMLNGAAVSVTHVYASAQAGFFDKQTEDIRVLLSDVPLDDETRRDVFSLIRLGREGRGHIVEVVIGASGVPESGALFAPEFGGMVSVTGMHAFSRDRLDPRTIAGRLFVDRPRTVQGVTFTYDVTFTAPIARPRTDADLPAGGRLVDGIP